MRIYIKMLSVLLISAMLCAFAPSYASAAPEAALSAKPSVSAKSAVLIEMSSGDIVFEKDCRERLPMASTTKIMTALCALEYGNVASDVSVNAAATGIEGSSVYLAAGEVLSMSDLVYALLLESANDAAAAIAIEISGSVEAFAELMNEKALKLGLSDTHFTNPHGLDNSDHYTSAYDLARLSAYALDNKAFAEIVSTYKKTIPLHGSEGVRLLINHNRLLKNYNDVIGVKTGYTKKSGRCLVSAAQRDGVTLIAVTLNAPNDWRDHRAMLDYGFTKYSRYELAGAFECEYTLPVIGGVTESVVCSNSEAFSAVLTEEQYERLESVLEINQPRFAPVSKGELVGKLSFYSDGRLIGSVPVTAMEDVSQRCVKKSLWQRIFG